MAWHNSLAKWLLLGVSLLMQVAVVQADIVRVAVRAHNGIELAIKLWQPTVDYLNQTIPVHSFELVPVIDLAELQQRAGAGEFEFVLTNPTSFVGLELSYGASALATLINKAGSGGVARFGSVFFSLHDRDDIQQLSDIRGQHLVAVSERAFGGWQVAWYELLENGIDPYVEAEKISFADGIQSQVVETILAGEADIGVVRTDMLERLAEAGRLQLSEVKVIHPRSVRNFPYRLSTSLYPEWAFARMPQASVAVSKAVANALLNMPDAHPATIAGNYLGWDSPHNYQAVRELMQTLGVGPYQGFGEVTLTAVVEKHWPWLLAILAAFALAVFQAMVARSSSKRLRKAQAALLRAKATLEERVAARTRELDRFKTTLDETLDCVFMFDPQTLKFFYVNAGAIKQVGYSYDELIGMTAYDIKPEYDEQAFRRMIAPMLAGECNSLSFETVHRHKDGSQVPVEIFLQYVMPAGESARFVAVVRDITARKKVETALREAEARQRTILETVVDGIITIDLQGTVLSFNPAAETIFGYGKAEVIGHNINMLMPEPYHSEHDGYLAHYGETSRPSIIGVGREVRGRRKDGSVFPLDLAVSESHTKEARYFTGIVRDITERKRVEQMKNEFISTVSHELRTPLTSIRGALGLVVGGAVGDALPQQTRDLLDIASNNTQRLLLLINDILDVQKMEAGKMAFHFSAIDMVGLLKRAIEDNASYGKQFDVRFTLATHLREVYVYADPDRLMQVLSNLLSNAAKFSPHGDAVVVSVVVRDAVVRVSVADHGPGIAEDFKDKLFDRFTQSDASDSRSRGGTGLGLSISKAVIEKHGGRIGVVSQAGMGSTFYFELPEVRNNLANKGVKDAVASPLRAGNPARVLVVEDDPDVAALLCRMLAEAGFDSDVAADAVEAERMLQDGHPYRAITLDIVLPGEDGLSLLSRVRAMPNNKDLPVVVVSVEADENKHELRGGAVGIADWLNKPIDQERLVNAVKRAASRGARPRVLHVEDDKDVHEVLSVMLKSHCDLLWATTVDASKKLLKQENFDLVLLDIGLPDGSGLELLDVIERQVKAPRVVIFSAQEVGDNFARKVSAVLVKSRTSQSELLEAITGAIWDES